MRIAIWGAGAIGGTVGAYLHRSGHQVLLVDARADHVESINRNGLCLEGGVELRADPPAATPEDVVGRFDTVLLCVKAQHTEAATRRAAGHLAEDGVVVTMQNGLNEPVIADIIGAERVIGALINRFHADYLSPGHIRYGGEGIVVIGELSGKLTHRITALRDLLADFHPRVTDNIWGYKWAKCAWGAILTATAVSIEPMAVLLADRRYQDLYVQLAKEVLGTAIASGVDPRPFPGFDASAFLPDVPVEVGRAALDHEARVLSNAVKSHTGIWRDLAVHHRETEVRAHYSAVLAVADQHGLRLSLIPALIKVVERIERGELTQGSDRLAELNAVHERLFDQS